MSKFLDNIEAKLLRDQYIEQLPLLAVNIKQQFDTENFRHLNEYRVSVEYGARFTCTPGEVKLSISNIREQLRDEIYGEFVQKLRELYRATDQQRRSKQLELINNLLLLTSGR